MKKLPAPVKKQGRQRLPIRSGKTSSWDLARAAKQIYDRATVRPTMFVDERIYFKIEFTNDTWLPNVRGAIEDMKVDVVNFIDDRTLTVALKRSDYGRLLSGLRRNRRWIRSVTETLISDKVKEKELAEDIIRGDLKRLDVTIQMFDASGLKQMDEIKNSLYKFLSSGEGTIVESYSSRNWALYSVHARARDIRQVVDSVGFIERVEEIPKITLVATPRPRRQSSISLASAFALQEATKMALPSVCAIDSGINRNHRYLANYVSGTYDFTTAAPGPCTDFDNHGSLVSGIIVYGGNLATHRETVTKVIMVKGFENGKPVGDVLRMIRETLQVFKERTLVFNLSFGARGPNEGMTRALNDIIYRNNVVMVVSAGNIQPEFIRNHLNHGDSYPQFINNHPIFFPGDAGNAVTVGSYATRRSNLFRGDAPSPFTSAGHDPMAIKPDVLAEGGNLNVERGSTGVVGVNYANVGVESTGSSGDALSENAGTSFSSPAVASLAGRILDRYPDANPFLVKALIISSSEQLTDVGSRKFDFMIQGYGVPSPDIAINSNTSRASYLMQGGFLGYNRSEYHRSEFFVPDNAQRLQIVFATGRPAKSDGYFNFRLYPPGPLESTVPRPSDADRIGPREMRWKISATYREVIPILRARRGLWRISTFPHFDKTEGVDHSLKYGCVITVESPQHRAVYNPIANWLEERKRPMVIEAKVERPAQEVSAAALAIA